MTSSASPRAPRRDFTENREAILLAAAAALNADPEASIDTIAAAAGLSRRAVYGHFASRDQLIGDLLEVGAARVAGALASLEQVEPEFRLAEIAERLWAEVAGIRVMAQRAVHGPHARQVGRILAPLRSVVVDVIRAGADAGRFRTDIDVPTLGRLVEGSALAVLDEATRSQTSVQDGRRLVVLVVLGTAGLSWREAAAVDARLTGSAA